MESEAPRVLLVDDEAFAREVYGDYLRESGCEVDSATGFVDGVDKFRPGIHQVVVTDLLLQDGDGIQVLSEVKLRDPDVDVIVLTGHAGVEPAVRALREGASDYLVKPVSRQALEASVGRCLSLRRLARENAELRSTLVLLEAGRRAAAAPDPVRMADVLIPSLLAESGGVAGICLRLKGGSYELLRADGLDSDELEDVTAAAADALLSSPSSEPRLLSHPPAVLSRAASASGGAVLVVPFPGGIPGTGESPLLGGALIFGGPGMLQVTGKAAGLARLDFLARSAAVAASAIQRIDEATELVYRDDLTELHNARFLKQVLDRETNREDEAPFAVVFLDLDHFKEVNDTRGHLEGSRVLVELARVLRSCVRASDVCTRYGGDEFCVVLPRTDKDSAMRVAERIRAGIAEHRFLASTDNPLRLTASVGVALFPEHGSTRDELLLLADQAMYRGKKSSRDVVYLAELPDAAA